MGVEGLALDNMFKNVTFKKGLDKYLCKEQIPWLLRSTKVVKSKY